MTREEYIEELRARISHLPKEERESALSYYIEYLEDATDKTMEEIIAELGTPGEVAERIIAECAQSNQERGENAGCLVGALAVLTSPVWLPVLFVIFVVGVVAIALLGAGFWALTAYPPTGIAVLGGALICLGLAMLCVLLFMWAGSALKSLMNAYRSRRQH